MSNTRSKTRWRPDAEILARESDIALLRAVASGRVVRGAGADTTVMAPHLLDGDSVRLELRWLYKQELLQMPISGPPVLAPRGRRLLQIANGEVAAPPE